MRRWLWDMLGELLAERPSFALVLVFTIWIALWSAAVLIWKAIEHMGVK